MKLIQIGQVIIISDWCKNKISILSYSTSYFFFSIYVLIIFFAIKFKNTRISKIFFLFCHGIWRTKSIQLSKLIFTLLFPKYYQRVTREKNLKNNTGTDKIISSVRGKKNWPIEKFCQQRRKKGEGSKSLNNFTCTNCTALFT